MSIDAPQPFHSNHDPSHPSQPGMSSGTKVLLILAAVALVSIALCAGVAILGGFLVAGYIDKAGSNDPRVIRQRSAEIAEIDLPEEFHPSFSLDMKIPFTGQRMMSMVFYSDEQTTSTLVLAALGKMFSDQDQQEIKDQIQESLREEGLGRTEATGTRKVEEKQITVRGQPETFTFITTKDPETGKTRLEVTGVFPNKDGQAMFLFDGDAEKYPQEKITALIESIR